VAYWAQGSWGLELVLLYVAIGLGSNLGIQEHKDKAMRLELNP
jgi:hypothetical protein